MLEVKRKKLKHYYYRYLVYNNMLKNCLITPHKRGLCALFEMTSNHEGILRDYIDDLPELKQACKNHSEFIGFDKYHWFGGNMIRMSVKEWNGIRKEVLIEAINLTYKKGIWTKLIESVKYAIKCVKQKRLTQKD